MKDTGSLDFLTPSKVAIIWKAQIKRLIFVVEAKKN
jgi:hypothetical protein